ncbi:unnamed protein product [Urochloa humidicola]
MLCDARALAATEEATSVELTREPYLLPPAPPFPVAPHPRTTASPTVSPPPAVGGKLVADRAAHQPLAASTPPFPNHSGLHAPPLAPPCPSPPAPAGGSATAVSTSPTRTSSPKLPRIRRPGAASAVAASLPSPNLTLLTLTRSSSPPSSPGAPPPRP